jgi:DNA-binding transcriptional ArsR family regulator
LPRRPNTQGTAALKGAAPMFAALGDENRLRIVARLCHDGPLSIARLTDGADVTRQAITKHLRVMESAGLVHVTRCGRETVWELDSKRLDQVRRHLDQISHDWDRALERLKHFVED